VKRWSAKKKTQVVLRLIRGESLDSVSRQIGLPAYILEEWCPCGERA
jgi:transposase-like protein